MRGLTVAVLEDPFVLRSLSSPPPMLANTQPLVIPSAFMIWMCGLWVCSRIYADPCFCVWKLESALDYLVFQDKASSHFG